MRQANENAKKGQYSYMSILPRRVHCDTSDRILPKVISINQA